MDVERYTVENEYGDWQGDWPLAEIEEARKAAQETGGKLLCLTFEFTDSELIEDYSGEEESDAPA